MTFFRGQKVVCVRGRTLSVRQMFEFVRHPYTRIEVGAIYTVANIFDPGDGDEALLELVEIPEKEDHYWMPGYRASAFRPIVDKKTDISFAHEILRETKAPSKQRELT